MILQFIGTYKSHTIKKTKNNKDYCELDCLENLSNKNVRIFIFKSELIERLDMLKENDNITCIFEFWYSKKENKNVINMKDLVVY